MKKTIKLDLNIYSKDKIIISISDFSDVAVIKLKGNELTIEWETNEEIDEIFLEFCNYVIWLMNE